MNKIRSLLLNEDKAIIEPKLFDEPNTENFKPLFTQHLNRLRSILFVKTDNPIVHNYQVDQAVTWCLADPITEQIVKAVDPINTYSRLQDKWFNAIKTFDEELIDELNTVRNVVQVDSLLQGTGAQNWPFLLNSASYADFFDSAKQLIRTNDLPVRRTSAAVVLAALEVL